MWSPQTPISNGSTWRRCHSLAGSVLSLSTKGANGLNPTAVRNLLGLRLSGPTGWAYIFTRYLLPLSTIVIIKLWKRNAFFLTQQHNHIPTPYLSCFACNSLLKKDENQKTKLELDKLDLVLLGWMCGECFCTAFWDLKSFPHLYLVTWPSRTCWKTNASFIAECPHIHTTLDFRFHEGLRLCSLSVHLGVVLFFSYYTFSRSPSLLAHVRFVDYFLCNEWGLLRMG